MSLQEARDRIEGLRGRVEPRPGSVDLDLTGPIARIALNNPGSRNAITLGMMLQLCDVVEALGAWEGGAAILTGGDVFCSGGHLGQVKRAVSSPDEAVAMAAAMTRILDAFLDLPQVTVAALDGLAVGGGAEIAVSTDFRTAGEHGRIHFIHARLGIAPGWGGAGRLVGHLGARSALRVLAEAAPVGPSEGLDLGLFDRVGLSGLAEAEALLAPMLANPAGAIRAVKAQIVAARHGDREGEARAFARVWGGPDHRAALAGIPAARDDG